MAMVQIKRLRADAVIPARGSSLAAGYDLCACLGGDAAVVIPPHHTVKIGTGLAFALPEGTFGAVFARSGLASRQDLRPANCVGVIDSDYTGEIQVGIINQSDTAYTVQPGERIAQLVIMPVLQPTVVETDTLEKTARGDGGFGSTGRH